MIYLDTIAAQRPYRSVVQAMIPYLEESFGSPLQPHKMGQELFASMELSYKAVFDFFRAQTSDRFVLTSSGQEAISQVAYSLFYEVIKNTGKNHCLVSAISEAAAVHAFGRLEEDGCVLTMCPLSKHGYIEVDAVAEAITPRTAILSLPSASALTGVVQPLRDIASLCRERGVLLHVDVTHAIGKQVVDLDDLGANYITWNGEQIGAPKGIGGLFSKNAPLIPLISGEDELARVRGGSLNVAALAALAQALREAKEREMLYCTEIARLRDHFEALCVEKIPEAQVLFTDEERLPHISSIVFPYVKNELLLFALNRKQLFASIGGASFQHIELVLEASQISRTRSQCALTFSLSHDTTESDVDKACHIIMEAYSRLRRLSKDLKMEAL